VASAFKEEESTVMEEDVKETVNAALAQDNAD
jgi:hypothetical protein